MKKIVSLAACLLFISTTAFAEIYKHVDADGRVTYSNIKTKGAVRLEIDSETPSGSTTGKTVNGNGSAKRTPTPSSFPRVDKNTQNERDNKRRSILQTKLEAEQAALEEAKKTYTEGESTPEVYRTANGKIKRNVPKYEEKMKLLKENVDNHQKNVELLQKELESLR